MPSAAEEVTKSLPPAIMPALFDELPMLLERHFEKAASLAAFLLPASRDPAFHIICPGERQTFQVKTGRTLEKDEFAWRGSAPEMIGNLFRRPQFDEPAAVAIGLAGFRAMGMLPDIDHLVGNLARTFIGARIFCIRAGKVRQLAKHDPLSPSR